MSFDWIKKENVRIECESCTSALKSGFKIFWLVDNIFGKDQTRLIKQIESINLSSVTIFDEIFIFNKNFLEKINNFEPVVVDITHRAVIKFEHFHLIEKIINLIKLERKNIKFEFPAHLTPTLIGYLLGYPIIYQLGRDGKSNWLNNLPLILYQVKLDNFVISSFSFPSEFFHEISDHCQKWEKSLNCQLTVTKQNICQPDVNL